MYCIVVEGTKEFLEDASDELVNKCMNKIGDNVFVVNSISNFDSIAKGLKNLQSYKKNQSKNKIYKTTSLYKI